MKRLVGITLLIVSLSRACSGASTTASNQRLRSRTSTRDCLYWTSSTTAATAPRATPLAIADLISLSSPRRATLLSVLRGGDSSHGSGSGGEEAALPQRLGAVEPAAALLDGAALKASGGKEEAVVDEVSKPASAVVEARQERKVDAKEKALREALLSADGPTKILREVERIPALRRLSDSALRVTSATPSDGRLAALALYRLGAEARAAESASPPAPASAAASAVKGKPPSPATAGGVVASGEGVLVTSQRVEGEHIESGSNTGGGGGGVVDVDEPGDAGRSAIPVMEAGGQTLASTSAAADFNTAGSAAARTSDGTVNEEQRTSGHADAVAPPVADDTGTGTFDMERVRCDQRFEQLVEIIECVATELSVSDISKVVWGLSILGHVPRNSLLESLATFLTDRLRQEIATGAFASPAAVAGGTEESATTGGSSGGVREGAGMAGVKMASDAAEEGEQGSQLVRPVDGDKRGVAAGAEDGNAGGRRGGDGDGAGGMTGVAVVAGAKTKDATTFTSGTDLATAALSFACAQARLDISTGKLMKVIAACAIPQLASTPLRDLANLSWAFAVQRQLDPDMMEGVGREIVSTRAAGRMTAKDASVFAWAYGMLGLRPARVIEALTREGLATIQEATPHDLSNLAWGLARAGVGGRDKEESEVEDPLASAASEHATSSGGAVGGSGKAIEGSEAGKRETTPAGGMGQKGGKSGVGVDGGGAGGSAWGLGWMRGKRSSRERDRDQEDGEEEVEEGAEGAFGGSSSEEFEDFESGEASSEFVNKDDASTSAGIALADLAPGGEEADASVEQRLGETLLARASDRFHQFQPKQLSRLCWALGAWHQQRAVSLPESGLFVARSLSEAGQHPKEYTGEELAQILWAFATLVGKSDSPAQDLAGLVGALAEGFESEGPREQGAGSAGVSGREGGLDAATACDVLWAFARMGHPAHSLCEAMARDLVDKVPELPPSSVSSLVWAYAKMGHPSAELMERVLSVVERRLDDFSVADAASALWALGALGYTVSLKRQFDVTKDDLRSLSPSASANLLWGLVKTEAAFADGFDRECLEVVAADMGPKLLSFSPRELCRTAWALGRLGLGGFFSGGSVADVGAGGAGESDDDGPALDGGEMSGLMDKLLGECSKWLELFAPQELETLLWAICRLEHRADDLVADMAAEGKRRQEELPSLLKQSGPAAARDAAFHLGAFRHLLAKYREIDFDGRRARGRYRRGKSMLSRMFRER